MQKGNELATDFSHAARLAPMLRPEAAGYTCCGIVQVTDR